MVLAPLPTAGKERTSMGRTAAFRQSPGASWGESPIMSQPVRAQGERVDPEIVKGSSRPEKTTRSSKRGRSRGEKGNVPVQPRKGKGSLSTPVKFPIEKKIKIPTEG